MIYVNTMDGATGERSITEQGFQFLLLDTYGQLWLLLREYIASANARFGAAADHARPHAHSSSSAHLLRYCLAIRCFASQPDISAWSRRT